MVSYTLKSKKKTPCRQYTFTHYKDGNTNITEHQFQCEILVLHYVLYLKIIYRPRLICFFISTASFYVRMSFSSKILIFQI